MILNTLGFPRTATAILRLKLRGCEGSQMGHVVASAPACALTLFGVAAALNRRGMGMVLR